MITTLLILFKFICQIAETLRNSIIFLVQANFPKNASKNQMHVFSINWCYSDPFVARSNTQNSTKLVKWSNNDIGEKNPRKKIVQNIADREKYDAVAAYAAKNEHKIWVRKKNAKLCVIRRENNNLGYKHIRKALRNVLNSDWIWVSYYRHAHIAQINGAVIAYIGINFHFHLLHVF